MINQSFLWVELYIHFISPFLAWPWPSPDHEDDSPRQQGQARWWSVLIDCNYGPGATLASTYLWFILYNCSSPPTPTLPTLLFTLLCLHHQHNNNSWTPKSHTKYDLYPPRYDITSRKSTSRINNVYSSVNHKSKPQNNWSPFQVFGWMPFSHHAN